jgi:hypothetical protein
MKLIIDYSTSQRDVIPMGKTYEQTTFCRTDVERHTVVGGADVALKDS